MHTNCQLLDALLKNLVALKVLVWSRGRLVTLQVPTSFSISLVEETHGSLGQCVSFTLIIDVGSGSTAYVVSLFLSFHGGEQSLPIVVVFRYSELVLAPPSL